MAGIVKVPSLLAAGLSSMFKYRGLSFDTFNPADPSLKEIIKGQFWDDNMDFSAYTAREMFWWRQRTFK